MDLANYLLLAIILSSFHFPSHGFFDEKTSTHLAQSMILKACEKIEDQTSCLASVRSRIKTHDRFSVLAAALENTLEEARSTTDMVSTLNTSSVGPREQQAVEDCAELLDFSVTELAWSLPEINNSRASGDVQAWLSAALGNQDTCLEGFEGTDRRLQRFMTGNLSQVTQLIDNVLTLYSQMPAGPPPKIDGDFPKWMSDGDKEMLVPSPKGMHVDAVVALDGTGHHLSVGEAILKAPSYNKRRYVIYVTQGVYEENIDMKKKTNIMLFGKGIGKTVITGNRSVAQRKWTTFQTATFAVSGTGFIARDMTFRNTAGPENDQAVALRVDSDKSAFYRCSMEGYQDTLYPHSLRQFYRECHIYGTVDFIFGDATAVFQKCNIHTREPLPGQKVTITAQGRKNSRQTTGFTIQDSYVNATSWPTYLGRPWKMYSRTVFMNTYMSQMVHRRGWLEWDGNFALNTLYYGEYENTGLGASVKYRVRWKGYHILKDASPFTVARFLDGESWLPATGVPFK